MDTCDIGAHLRAIRAQLGLSQVEAGRLLSVSNMSVSKWETGKAFPSRLAYEKILKLEDRARKLERKRRKSQQVSSVGDGP